MCRNQTTPSACSPHSGAIIDDDSGADTQAIPTQPVPTAEWRLAGRYRVIERVGSGGMAEVFRAHDELLGRDVAVKVFRSLVEADAKQDGRARQELELQALARLNHPNLITLFDASLSGGTGPGFLVMELVDGPSLGARLAQGPLPEPALREVGAQIADALAYVHAEGMVHRDVTPANILLGCDLTGGMRARLSDFGIVRMLGSERMTSAELTLGTACYLAPEQARGADVGPEADSYALGLVLLEALTGVRAYEGSPVEAAVARLSRAPDIPSDLPQPWPRLLAAMTAGEPEARPPAADVARSLRGNDPRMSELPPALLAASTAASLAEPTAASTADRPDTAELLLPQRRRGGLLAALVALLALVGAAAYVVARPASQPHTGEPAGVQSTASAHPSSPHRAQQTASSSSAPVGNLAPVRSAPRSHSPSPTGSATSPAVPTSRAPASSSPVPSTTAPATPTATPTPSATSTPTQSPSPTTSGGSGTSA